MGLLERARQLMLLPGGFDVLYRRVGTLERAGLFGTGDWASPALLKPPLAKISLRSSSAGITLIEAISEIRGTPTPPNPAV